MIFVRTSPEINNVFLGNPLKHDREFVGDILKRWDWPPHFQPHGLEGRPCGKDGVDTIFVIRDDSLLDLTKGDLKVAD